MARWLVLILVAKRVGNAKSNHWVKYEPACPRLDKGSWCDELANLGMDKLSEANASSDQGPGFSVCRS